MRLTKNIIALFVLAGCLQAKAAAPPDEGMWLPFLISQNMDEMKRLGFQLTPEQVYSVNQSSLKDAIVHFGGFCTGEIISSEGLILTNHHCGYDAVQSLSTVEQNHLANGFWAKSKAEELPSPGLFVRFLVRMEDVTAKVNAKLDKNLEEGARAEQLGKIFKEISKEATNGTEYIGDVRAMYYGSEFYLFVYEQYNDVRLVGVPPESIGKFGGDTDNWMWPRHTGDFSMFRVYAGKDGKPAEYSKENVPLKPKHFLPVSTAGVKPGDFSMVFGFPGRTQRYLTSDVVQLTYDQSNPARIKLREKRLGLWKEDMDADPGIRLKYAAKYAQIANYYKYFIGQNKGLKRLRTIAQKQEDEQKFLKWASSDGSRKAKYGSVIQNMADAVNEFRKYNLSAQYLNEAALGSEVLRLALQMNPIYNALNPGEGKDKKQVDNDGAKAAAAQLLPAMAEHFKDYNKSTDQKVTAALLKMYYDDVPKDQHPPIFAEIQKKYKGDFNKFAAALMEKSFLANEAKTKAFLANPTFKEISNDPAVKAFQSIFTNFQQKIAPAATAFQLAQNKYGRLYVEGLREMDKQHAFYPDANSTLRLTYGTVKPYKPMDGVSYDYYTTLKGVIEKEDPKDPEFVVPQKMIDLYKKKDFGTYAVNGDVPVCFISNNDITGGNSGSPVINGKGELIGLAFDGNWEAMSGDIVFDPELKRTINVDVRYILFIVDKMAGASNIINELKLVN